MMQLTMLEQDVLYSSSVTTGMSVTRCGSRYLPVVTRSQPFPVPTGYNREIVRRAAANR